MIGRGIDEMKNRADDRTWRYLLKQHDPVAPPSAAELAALEDRILAQVNALPEACVPAGVLFASWTPGREWVMRGACLAAVLFVLLGFLAGRSFGELSSQAADSTELFASAGGLPWQSFITAPSSSGETDDTAE